MTMFGSQWLANAGSTYEIDQSIRFNDNDSGYLYRTPSSASNRRTWTLSYWIKRANLGGFMNTFDARLDGDNYAKFQFHSGDYLQFLAETGGGGAYNLATTRLFRDPSAWYHIVLAVDTTQSTAADRVKIYVNGTQETSFISASYPAQNYDTFVNTTNGHALAGNFGGAAFLDGYMAEINFVDGQQLDPSSFGEVNSDTGQWIAKKNSGSYGTNGFYITGEDSADLGADYSGNGNDFTSSGLAAADQMSDSPTSNWCTMNSLAFDSSQITLTDGNLTLAWNTPNGDGGTTALSTFDLSQHGKSYWEFSAANSSVNYSVGICTNTSLWRKPRTQSTYNVIRYGVQDASTASMQVTSGDGSIDSTGVLAITGSEVGMMAFDPASGKLWVGQDGTFFNSGDPAAGSDEQGTFTGGNNTGLYVNVEDFSSAEVGAVTFNFGQSGFAHTPPTGFTALNSSNAPDPAIADPSDYFTPYIYTGDDSGTSRVFTGVGFAPNLVWTKARSSAFAHSFFDTVRGTGKYIASSYVGAEVTNPSSGYITAFGSDGYTFSDGASGSGPRNNYNADSTYVSWNWVEGATPGFDIVSYTGNATARTISHSAGVVPEMIIVKNLADTDNWAVYHAANTAAPATDYLVLNERDATADDATVWNDTAPTSSVFSVGTSSLTNGNTEAMIAYVFAPVEGFSAFGSYVGNGNANGPMVNVGFQPAFLLLKSTGDNKWILKDTKRSPFNASSLSLVANNDDAELTSDQPIDINSNGFKLRTTGSGVNSSGVAYVYAAFAEAPFKTANAR